MTTAEAITAGSSTSPLEAFNGSIRRPKTGFLYQAGLAIVAFAMVLLPLVYLESDAHIDRLFALNYRLIGTLLGLANTAEQALQPDVE
jgi:hypothetical protein